MKKLKIVKTPKPKSIPAAKKGKAVKESPLGKKIKKEAKGG